MAVKAFFENLQKKSDDELLAIYRSGESRAVTVLLARYAGVINGISRKYTINSVDIDDIKQEAYMGFLGAIRSYKISEAASFYTYAQLCVSNCIKNLLTAQATNKAQIYKKSVSIDEIENHHSSKHIRETPETIFIENEDHISLLQLINDSLSQFEKEVMYMHLSGYDYSSIAIKLNSSRKSVDNALQRSRRKLKTVFRKL